METIPSGTWVVVADGAKARFLSNVGENGDVSLKQQQHIESNDSDDPALAGGEPMEALGAYVDEPKFARQLAHRLNAAALKQEFSHLVLVADPHTLGLMRPLLHVETVKRMLGELAKTLTNAPLEDIERALKAAA